MGTVNQITRLRGTKDQRYLATTMSSVRQRSYRFGPALSLSFQMSIKRTRFDTNTTAGRRMPGNAAAPVPLLTRKEVAVLAKVCTRTIARDVRDDRLPEIRFNRRRIRYRAEDVQAYLAAA